jgi:hypothetical protein
MFHRYLETGRERELEVILEGKLIKDVKKMIE